MEQELSYRKQIARQLRTQYVEGIYRSKGKGKGLDTWYSATYMSQTRDQQRFTVSEVAADWHEPLVSQRIMWPTIARSYYSFPVPLRVGGWVGLSTQ